MYLAEGFRFKSIFLFLAIMLVVAVAPLGIGSASAADDPGVVYTINNAASGNEVVIFNKVLVIDRA